jgi:ketosteroid isomerase-like protein
MKTTVCFEKRDDEWKVTHEHISMPIDESGKGATSLKP